MVWCRIGIGENDLGPVITQVGRKERAAGKPLTLITPVGTIGIRQDIGNGRAPGEAVIQGIQPTAPFTPLNPKYWSTICCSLNPVVTGIRLMFDKKYFVETLKVRAQKDQWPHSLSETVLS